MSAYVYLLLLTFFVSSSDALKCYVCSATEYEFDKSCFDNPEDVDGALRSCNKNYCTSVRIEYLEPRDKVQSIIRNCMDDLGTKNQVLEDGYFRIYYKSCQEDGCNGGTGKDVAGSSISKDQGYGVLYVPGRSSASKLLVNLSLLGTVFFLRI